MAPQEPRRLLQRRQGMARAETSIEQRAAEVLGRSSWAGRAEVANKINQRARVPSGSETRVSGSFIRRRCCRSCGKTRLSRAAAVPVPVPAEPALLVEIGVRGLRVPSAGGRGVISHPKARLRQSFHPLRPVTLSADAALVLACTRVWPRLRELSHRGLFKSGIEGFPGKLSVKTRYGNIFVRVRRRSSST